MTRKYWVTFLLVVLVVLLLGPGAASTASTQPLTHTVQKGDTLWDICDKYYGDPTLWPKLWEMNPFITNPHLLAPGDTIVLLEKTRLSEFPEEEKKVEAPEKDDDTLYITKGVDVSGWVNADSLGFLSSDKVDSSGHICSASADRVMLGKGDSVRVNLKKGKQADPGGLFTVFRISPLPRRLFIDEDPGYLVDFIGRVALGEFVKENQYNSLIVESYKPIQPGDLIMPYQPVSSCVNPLPADTNLVTSIISDKEQRTMLAQYSVVYLAHGYNQGVRRGNLFEITNKDQGVSSNESKSPAVSGYVLVVESRPDSATGVVISSTKEMRKGVLLRGVGGAEAKEVFSSMPECIIK